MAEETPKRSQAFSPAIDVEDSDQTQSEAQIIVECPEKRTENTKTFLTDDGTFLKASYNEPIHYKDSTNTWQDIDNTLNVTNTKALASAQVMENKAGNTKFKLSKTINSGNTISLNSGNFSVSWGLDGANTAASQIVANQEDGSTESHMIQKRITLLPLRTSGEKQHGILSIPQPE